MSTLFNHFFSICDAPRAWGVYFQDSASPQMEALVELHDNITFYLVIFILLIGWILVSIIRNYISGRSASNKYLNHGKLPELTLISTPALILTFIAFPYNKLLYLMDEVIDPCLTVFEEGNQWYWSYQYPDYLNEGFQELEFDSRKYIFHYNDYDPDVPIPSIEEGSDIIEGGSGSGSSEGGSSSEGPEDVSSCSCGCEEDHAWEREGDVEESTSCCECEKDIAKGTGAYINDTCSCTICDTCL